MAETTVMKEIVVEGPHEHLKIDTRLIDERGPSVMGECDLRMISCVYFHQNKKR